MTRLYKKQIFLAAFAFILMCGSQVLAQQLPQINYQGVARKADGSPVMDQAVAIKLTIHDGSASGTSVYSETRKTTTNKFGLFSLVIGSGGSISQTGAMANINWATGNKFLQVEIDPSGGTGFIDMGTSQLQSVPYAIYASSATPGGTAGGDLSGIFPNPTVKKLQGAAVSTAVPLNGQVLKWTGTAWTPSDVATSLPQANATTDGFLSKADWLMFSGKVTINYVDAAIAASATALGATSTALAAEVTRATTAEGTLNAAIVAETSRGIGAEGSLATALASETTRATAAEGTKEVLANKSISISTDATSDEKYPSVKSVKNYVDGSVATHTTANTAALATVSTALATEVTRATTAEGTLNAAIVAETSRAIGAEGNLATDLASETTRATAAEGTKEVLTNKSISVTADATSDVKYPSVKSVKAYVDSRVSGVAPTFTNGSVVFSNGTTLSEDNSNFFWNNTNKRLGILTSNPTATFQIGPKDNYEAESLSWGKMADNMNTLQMGYRQTYWKLKAGNNSGVITSLNIASNNGGNDVTRMIFDQESNRTTILDPLTATKSITSPLANLSSLYLNNGAMSYSSDVPGKIDLLTSTPYDGSFKIGESQANLRYEYSGFGATSALSLGFRQYSMAFRLLTNSGVGYGLTLNHNNGTIDKPLITFLQDGTITAYDRMTAGSFVKQGGTSSQFLMADGSVFTADGSSGTGTNGQLTYWTSTGTQAGATNLIWENTGNFLKVGSGASTETFDYQNPSMPTTAAVVNVIGAPAASTSQIMLRLKRGHNQGTSYAGLADFVMTGGAGNAMQLDLKIGHQNNTGVFNAMTFTNGGKVGVGNTNPQAEFDVTGAGNFTSTLTAQSIVRSGGLATQILAANGTVLTAGTNITIASGTISATAGAAIREVADEITATASQTSFTLTQTPSVNSKVKMYVNGIRISNTAYSISGVTLTYNSTNNGANVLTAGDRIQFDYYY